MSPCIFVGSIFPRMNYICVLKISLALIAGEAYLQRMGPYGGEKKTIKQGLYTNET